MARRAWIGASVGAAWGVFTWALIAIERLREPILYDLGVGKWVAPLLPSVWAVLLAPNAKSKTILVLSAVFGAVAGVLLVKLVETLARRRHRQ